MENRKYEKGGGSPPSHRHGRRGRSSVGLMTECMKASPTPPTPQPPAPSGRKWSQSCSGDGTEKKLLLSGHLSRYRTSQRAYKGLVLGCDLEKSEPEEAQVPPAANEETKPWKLNLGSPGESEPRGSPAWDCSPVACNSGSPSHFPGLLSQRRSRSPSPAARELGPSPSRGCSQGHRQHLARQTWIFSIRGRHQEGGPGEPRGGPSSSAP